MEPALQSFLCYGRVPSCFPLITSLDEDESVRVAVLSITAAGTGLTLTESTST